MRWYSAPALVLLAALAVALGACGGGTSAEDEVREAAIVAGETEDPKVFCRQLVTDRFIDEVFGGDVATCLESDVVEDNPGKPIVSDVVIEEQNENAATVAIRVKGGEADGTSGHLGFAKIDDEWLLDRFETDYLRSVFAVGVEKVDTGAVSTPAMKNCIGKQIEGLADPAIRELTFNSLSAEAKAEKKLIGFAEECPGPLADYVADEIAKALTEDSERSPAFIRCAHDEISFFLEITGIAPGLIVDEPDFATMAALEGIVSGVRKNCSGK